MINLDVKNINEWSLKKKIISSVMLLLAIWIVWSIFGGANPATVRILGLPDGKIQIANNGEKVDLNVKIGDSDSTFNNVSQEVVKKTVLYSATPFPASAPVEIKKTSIPIEVALFGSSGNLIAIYDVPANTRKTYNPEKEYQYTIMAPEGYFANRNISLENNSKLLVDTLKETSE